MLVLGPSLSGGLRGLVLVSFGGSCRTNVPVTLWQNSEGESRALMNMGFSEGKYPHCLLGLPGAG